VTAKTLRHYDRLGLLQPQRSAAGYRVYSEKDLQRLEQIVALKFLGLPLKEIRRVLERNLPLTQVLLGQRIVLEEKRRLLERAIAAIRDVERVIASGKQPDTAILKKLIEVIAMQSHVQAMKQYYSNAAWQKLTRLRQQYSDAQPSGLSDSWAKLVREAGSILTEDPAGEKAQEFCDRWVQLWKDTGGDDADILAGFQKAWADRASWPVELRPLAEFDPKTTGDFIRKAYAVSMKKYYTDEAWAHKLALDNRSEIKQAWQAFYQEVEAAVSEDPASEKGRHLAQRWCQLWDATTEGDPGLEESFKRSWENRDKWPLLMREGLNKSNIPKLVDWIGKAVREYRASRS
jgi:DNA-binding transcriptional MerR regulator